MTKEIIDLINDLQSKIGKSEDTQAIEEEIGKNINKISEINEFFNLPMESILRIFLSANKNKVDIDDKILKTTITNLIKAKQNDSILLLNVLEMPNSSLFECVNIVTCFQTSPLCNRISSLIEEDVRKDWYCDLTKKPKQLIINEEITEKPADFEPDLNKAILIGKLSSVIYLVSHGAPLNIENKKGYSPLHLAVKEGSPDIIEYLLQHGANLEIRDKIGYTPLHIACKYGDLTSVNYLLDKGSSTRTKDKRKGFTPLHIAAKFGDIEIVTSLVQHGALIDDVSISGMTPLFIAAMNGFFDIVKYLVENNANKEIANDYGQTPLHVAVEKGCCMTVKFLLSHGSNKDIKDKNGKTPFDYSKTDKMRQLFN